LPLIDAPAAPPARIESLSNSNTGNFPTDGASSELYSGRQTPARSSSASARTSRLTSGGLPVNRIAAQFSYAHFVEIPNPGFTSKTDALKLHATGSTNSPRPRQSAAPPAKKKLMSEPSFAANSFNFA